MGCRSQAYSQRSASSAPAANKIPGHLIKWRRDYQSREALASLLATRGTDSPASIDLHPSRSKLRGIEPRGIKARLRTIGRGKKCVTKAILSISVRSDVDPRRRNRTRESNGLTRLSLLTSDRTQSIRICQLEKCRYEITP